MERRNTSCSRQATGDLSHFSDDINQNVVRSEIEGGVFLKRMRAGDAIEVRTENRAYRIVVQGRGRALISGHPRFCPDPVLVQIHGSSWGGSMLKLDFIGRGMFLEFEHPTYSTVTTSRIVEIREVEARGSHAN